MHPSFQATFAQQAILSNGADIPTEVPALANDLPLHFVERCQNLPPYPLFRMPFPTATWWGERRCSYPH